MTTRLERAEGCLLGQLAGDSLGSLVEFETPAMIEAKYPNGVRLLANGGTFNTLAGQPTDDSEMALLLARMLVERGTYDSKAALTAYQYWLDTKPFDCGVTIGNALRGSMNPNSQANGAMMRVSPLGIFGSRFSLEQVAMWAAEDAILTHPNPVCLQANLLFTMAISHVVATGVGPQELYETIVGWAKERQVDETLMAAIVAACESPHADFMSQMGWVLIAFRNALYQLLHAPNLEEALVDTVGRGGDTDTNAAICGALLGAVYGRPALPEQWVAAVLNCRTETGLPGVVRPRPSVFWPVDALELARELVGAEVP